MNDPVVCRSVGRSGQNFLKGRESSLPCSYGSTFYLKDEEEISSPRKVSALYIHPKRLLARYRDLYLFDGPFDGPDGIDSNIFANVRI